VLTPSRRGGQAASFGWECGGSPPLTSERCNYESRTAVSRQSSMNIRHSHSGPRCNMINNNNNSGPRVEQKLLSTQGCPVRSPEGAMTMVAASLGFAAATLELTVQLAAAQKAGRSQPSVYLFGQTQSQHEAALFCDQLVSNSLCRCHDELHACRNPQPWSSPLWQAAFGSSGASWRRHRSRFPPDPPSEPARLARRNSSPASPPSFPAHPNLSAD
jgi:hypothetical protein